MGVLRAFDVLDPEFVQALAQEDHLLVEGPQVGALDPVGAVQLPDDEFTVQEKVDPLDLPAPAAETRLRNFRAQRHQLILKLPDQYP